MFASDDEVLTFLLEHPFAGGAPEEGETTTEGEHQEGQGERPPSGGNAQPGETGRPPVEGQWIPKHRFDEVNTQFGQYKQFGRPEDVKKRLDRLAELEQLPQNRLNQKEKSEIRKELLQVFPELQVMANTVQVQREAYTDRGATLNNDFLKELNIEANEANNNYLQELLSGIIAADPKLLRRFYSMDDRVFQDAFKIAKQTFWPGVRKPVPGARTESIKLPGKAPGQQKVAGQKPPVDKAPTTRMEEREALDDASERAFALLDQAREGDRKSTRLKSSH